MVVFKEVERIYEAHLVIKLFYFFHICMYVYVCLGKSSDTVL